MASSVHGPPASTPTRVRIGAWEVDSARNELRRGQESVRLEPKVIEVLMKLAQQPGEVFSREELLSALWPGVIVGDDALTQAIIKLRKALRDDAHKPTYIETISKRGYRLIAPVDPIEPAARGEAATAQQGRRLAAILSADIAGYSRLMGEDDAATVQALKAHQARVLPLIEQTGGRVIDLAGDGILAEFPSAIGAVQCAAAIQRAMAESNRAVPRSRQMRFRIGVNLGDVIHDRKRIYGDGINVAARIQALASPGGLVVSKAVFDQVRQAMPERFDALGSARLKNIREPVALYQMQDESGARKPAWLTRWRFLARTRPAPVAAAAVVVSLAVLASAAIPLTGKSLRMPWPIGTDTKGAASSMPVVAVLPLSNLSGDAKREYFTDGMTQDIISALGRFSGLRVMSLNAVQEFKAKPASLKALQSELGARYIVKGSVREGDRQIRVAVELSDAEKGVLLWSDRFDGQASEIFEIQDRIVRSVASALHVKLKQLEQQRAFTRPTESLEAHDLVLRARHLIGQVDRRANLEARFLLAKARELAPGYGEILTAQGVAEMHRALYGWVEDPVEAMTRAEELARLALANPDTRTHAAAHVLLSAIYSNTERYEDTLKHADLALAANPSDADALYRKGSGLLFMGRAEQAISAIEAAHRVNPAVGDNSANLAYAYYILERYGDALAITDAMLARTPEHITLLCIRAAALAQLGRSEDARQAADRIRRLSPAFQVANFARRFAEPTYLAKLRDGLNKAGLE